MPYDPPTITIETKHTRSY